MEYKEFRKRGLEQTGVWLYFLKAVDNKTAKCKKCNKILKAEGGSTSSLRSHIRTAHGITLESGPMEQTENQPQASLQTVQTKKSKIQDYFKSDQSMEMIVSRMVCLDGLTFRVFANSVDLRRLFLKSGHQLPSSPNTIRNIVLQRCEFVKQQILQALMKLKLRGLLFSITMDEWTSLTNKRYINVNIHSPDIVNRKYFYNVGLIRIRGSATSTRCAELLNERLQSFGLNIEDIVGLSTDAASVMKKMGRGIPAYHQLCYAHGLQLAILDVLYKNQPVMCFESEDCSSGSEFSGADGEDNDSDDDEGFIIESPQTRVPISNASCKSVIEKVRKVCKMFRKSPTKNDEALQKYVQQNFDKEINLILDCKTRWSSLASMLERFIKLYSCVQLALYDIRSEISFSTDEIELIKHIHATLDIFKASLEMLCENDSTLLTADVVLIFLLKELKKTTGPLSAAFITALRKRIGERYLLIQGVLKYLDNPDDFYNETDVDSIFVRPSQDDIVSILVSLLGKNVNNTAITVTALDPSPETSQSSENIEPIPSTSGLTGSFVSAKDLLREELKQKSLTRREAEKTHMEVLQQQLCPNVIQIEIALHESGGTRGRYLEMAYRTLLSIKPTSVECERTFSTAGYLCSKFRSRLNDATLNALIILKHYFISTKE